MVGNRVRAVFAEVFRIDPAILARASSPDTVQGWDSFGHLELVRALEHEFKITFEVDDIARMETLGQIEEIVVRRGAAQ